MTEAGEDHSEIFEKGMKTEKHTAGNVFSQGCSSENLKEK